MRIGLIRFHRSPRPPTSACDPMKVQTFSVVRERLGQDLDRDVAIQLRVAGPEHLPHAACADAGDNFVDTETGTGGSRNTVWSEVSWTCSICGVLPFYAAPNRRRVHDIEIVVIRQADTHAMFYGNSRFTGTEQLPPHGLRAPSVNVPNSWVSSFMANSKTSEPVEVCWRVVEGSSSRMLTCAIFGASTDGVELRVGYFVDMPLHSRMMRDIDSARVLAQDWLDAVRAAAQGNKVESWP